MNWLKQKLRDWVLTDEEKTTTASLMKNDSEPYFEIVDFRPEEGYFEFDWNDAFIQWLGEEGYSGETPEQIVSLYFNDVCRSVAAEVESEE